MGNSSLKHSHATQILNSAVYIMTAKLFISLSLFTGMIIHDATYITVTAGQNSAGAWHIHGGNASVSTMHSIVDYYILHNRVLLNENFRKMQ